MIYGGIYFLFRIINLIMWSSCRSVALLGHSGWHGKEVQFLTYKKLAIYNALKHVPVLDCGFINIHGHQFIWSTECQPKSFSHVTEPQLYMEYLFNFNISNFYIFNSMDIPKGVWTSMFMFLLKFIITILLISKKFFFFVPSSSINVVWQLKSFIKNTDFLKRV